MADMARGLIDRIEVSSDAAHTAAGDIVMGNAGLCVVKKTSGAATQVTLPARATNGVFATVKDGKGDAATNNITIIPDGTTNNTTIDGAANFVISENYGSVQLLHDGTEWGVVGTGLAISVAELGFLNGVVAGTGAASKAVVLDANGDVTMPDLGSIGFGGVAKVSWDTTDANANEMLIQLPAGGAVDVPVIIIGQSIEAVDPGLYNGVTEPRLAMFGVGAVATGPVQEFRKARGTFAAPTVVTSADDLGSLDFYGAVAAGEYVRAAQVLVEMTGTIATTRGPGVITFKTATDAAPSVLTTAMTISAAQLVTCAAGVTVTTGNVTISAGNAVLGEATLPAGSICYIGRDNTGDTNINALTGKTINLQVNGADIATLSATVLSFTGTIAATGARVTQSFHTNLTSTNAVTVDSSETVKRDIALYRNDALAAIRAMDVITFRHQESLDPAGHLKLGLRAESVREPLAVDRIAREDGGDYPGVNLYGLAALQTRAIQQLSDDNADLRKRLGQLEAKR